MKRERARRRQTKERGSEGMDLEGGGDAESDGALYMTKKNYRKEDKKTGLLPVPDSTC